MTILTRRPLLSFLTAENNRLVEIFSSEATPHSGQKPRNTPAQQLTLERFSSKIDPVERLKDSSWVRWEVPCSWGLMPAYCRKGTRTRSVRRSYLQGLPC